MKYPIILNNLIIVSLLILPSPAWGQGPEIPTARELIHRVTKNEYSDGRYPNLPNITTQVQENIVRELYNPAFRVAYAKLDPGNRGANWEEGVAELEQGKAIWSLASLLCSPRRDLQAKALESLAAIGDPQVVPFLLIYAEYMAIHISGSENATIHGLIQEDLARTLSVLTGVEVRVRHQDIEGLRKGIKLWQGWLLEHDQPRGFVIKGKER